jgi:carboxyl-terminal processing protease
MNREKLAWSVSVLLMALLAFQMPRGLAQRDNDYAFVRTLVDIHRQVSNNYVDPIEAPKLENGAIDGMLSQLDPFSVYVPPAKQEEFDRMLEGSFKGVGIQLNQTDDGKIEVVTPIDGSPAFKAGVMAGDIITKVNGESVEGQRLPEVIKRISGKLGSEVTLHVRHATGEEADLTMTREEVVVPTIKGYSRKQDNTWDYYACEDPKIAYVRMTQFTPDTYEKLRAVLTGLMSNGMKGLILDLRWNPGGRLDEAEKIVNLFIDHGTIVVTRGRNRPETVRKATPESTLPKFPMVVLVNEHSASASEIVAGSLMDNKRAVVVGARTYGKGSVQELIPLEGNNGELKLTVAYYYLPSGRLVHKKKDATDWGVQPQIVVPMDDATERKVMDQRYEQELFRRPVAKASTNPTTQPGSASLGPSTKPTTQPVDTQLQAAVNTLIGFIIFADQHPGAPMAELPATRPAQAVAVPLEPAPAEPSRKGPSTLPRPAERDFPPEIRISPATAPSTRPVTAPSGSEGTR